MRRRCQRTATVLLVLSGLGLLAPGCYESFTRPLDVLRPDTGVVDGGTISIEAPRDGSAMDLPDSAGAGGGDARDGGRCAGELIASYAGPGCSPDTRTCRETCGEPDCVAECYALDPECVRCIDQTRLSCGNELGCQPLWDAFACCTDWSCPEGTAGLERLRCTDTCEPELVAYLACLDGDLGSACEARLAACDP